MIISHKHKFIFIKTKKTAGTSIEGYLAQFCGEDDIIAPHEYLGGKNHTGFFNPLIDLRYYLKYGKNDFMDLIYNLRNGKNGNGKGDGGFYGLKRLMHLREGVQYHQHLPAVIVRSRVGREIWDNYFKFCFERNPWDKVLSHYYHKCAELDQKIDFDDFMSDSVYWKWPMNHLLYSDFSGKVMVDYIGYYENLEDDLCELLEKLDIPTGELPMHRSNTIKTENYQDFFSNGYEKYVDKISDCYKKEIKLHRYSFQ